MRDDDTGTWSRSPRSAAPVRTWPLLVLAIPAAVAIFSGWVGIGEMTGFGVVRPLPGIWGSFHVDTAITLPVGVEAYAAIALRAWLAASSGISARTRRFARCSAIGALGLGSGGQVAYHLLAQDHVRVAPWPVTTLVACLPVVVLGFGTALAHMLRADLSAPETGQLETAVLHGPAEPKTTNHRARRCSGPAAGKDRPAGKDQADSPGPGTVPGKVQAIADALTASGQRVSRRTLRAAGIRGSNAELAALARAAREPAVGRSVKPAA